jgi:hypothetical protein
MQLLHLIANLITATPVKFWYIFFLGFIVWRLPRDPLQLIAVSCESPVDVGVVAISCTRSSHLVFAINCTRLITESTFGLVHILSPSSSLGSSRRATRGTSLHPAHRATTYSPSSYGGTVW